jgi:hypothetical protein
MNKFILLALLLLITKAGLAQTDKDSLVYNLPLVKGKLTYADTIKVKGHSQAQLDTAAKKWFAGYFKYAIPDTLAADKDKNSIILNRTAIDFKISNNPYSIKYNFLLVESIKVKCTGDGYTYKITNIRFIPKSSLARSVTIYETSPEVLIDLYENKDRGQVSSINMGKKKIREYLSITDNKIKECISSLNKAMAN